MRYRLMGRSGLRVSELCLGAMTFGEEFGWGASEEESRRVFDLFAESGGNFIDTANHYTKGTSERMVGKFVGADRDRFVIATKYTLNQFPDDPNAGGNHRKNLVHSLEASLERLGTDYVDLYWVHAWDGLTPVEEVMRALDDVVRAGKALYVGISDTPAWIVSQANTIADLRGWSRFVGLQIEYSLIQRTPERDLLPMAGALGLAVTPWAVLGMGVLTGKYLGDGATDTRLAEGEWRESWVTERNNAIAAAVVAVAEEIGRTPAQVAVNWVRHQQGRATVIPIVGAKTEAQLRDNLTCLEFELSAEHLARLDEVSRIDLGFPHEFLARDGIRQLILGTHADAIDP
jgi:aryl-alcohol dehydrogenase-like predicted oxidoreductase